jgi:preprotein translocase subunit SecG
MNFLFYFTIIIFLLLSGLLSLVVLMQESKSLGLGASFGGDPGESLFGTSTAEVLKKFTAWVAVAFVAASFLLSIWCESLGTQPPAAPFSIEELQDGQESR